MAIFFYLILIFWIAAAGYALRLGYLLLAQSPLVWSVASGVAAMLLAGLYVWVGLRRFRDRQEVLPFEIVWFFLLNRYALLAYVFAMGAYAQAFFAPPWDAIIFIIAAAAAFGSLLGCFLSERYLDRLGIRRRYPGD